MNSPSIEPATSFANTHLISKSVLVAATQVIQAVKCLISAWTLKLFVPSTLAWLPQTLLGAQQVFHVPPVSFIFPPSRLSPETEAAKPGVGKYVSPAPSHSQDVPGHIPGSSKQLPWRGLASAGAPRLHGAGGRWRNGVIQAATCLDCVVHAPCLQHVVNTLEMLAGSGQSPCSPDPAA